MQTFHTQKHCIQSNKGQVCRVPFHAMVCLHSLKGSGLCCQTGCNILISKYTLNSTFIKGAFEGSLPHQSPATWFHFCFMCDDANSKAWRKASPKHYGTIDVFACCDWIRVGEHAQQFVFGHLCNFICLSLKHSVLLFPHLSPKKFPHWPSHNFTVTQLFTSLLAGNHGELTSHPGTGPWQWTAPFSSLCPFIL